MKSNLPNETIKPAYPLGDANADVKEDKNQAPTRPPPTTTPKKVDEPQTDGE